MPTSSTIPGFRAALITALQAHADLADVQVTRRWPGPDTQDEGIYLGDCQFQGEIASIKTGRQRRNETYGLTIICQTWSAAPTPDAAADAEARVYALWSAVEDLLADSPSLGGINWGRITDGADELIPFQTGWAARITATITNVARLT